MLYLVVCTDKPESAQVRLDNRPDHIEFLKGSSARLKVAGPTVTEDGEGMTGSMLVIEATSQADAEGWAAQDPYAQAGLFESVTIRPWKWTFGNPDA
jgi:uncharacterized protein YciI